MENSKMTYKEMDSIMKAMKKPEFHQLINEYVDEISDPKNKIEYENYLRQMEKQNELPPNTKLVQPTKAFCIKTTSKRHASTKKNQVIEQKLFINICSEDSIESVKEVKQKESGAEGVYYTCPYTLSKGRPDKDKKGQNCVVYDVIFNPKAISLSINMRFQKFLCDTAIDALNQYLAPYNEIASHDYKLLKKIACKGDKPALITVKVQSDSNSLSSNVKISSHQTSLQKEIEKEKIENAKKLEQPEAAKENDDDIPMFMKNKPKPTPAIVTNYDLTYIYDTDISETINDPLLSRLPQIPMKIRVVFNLPTVESIKDIDLNISEKHLKVHTTQNNDYSVLLSYPIFDDKITAKFDKAKKALTVIIEVDRKKFLKDHNDKLEKIQSTKDSKDAPELVKEDESTSRKAVPKAQSQENNKKEEKQPEIAKNEAPATKEENAKSESLNSQFLQDKENMKSEEKPKIEMVKEIVEPQKEKVEEKKLNENDVKDILKSRQCFLKLQSSPIYQIY